MIQYWDLNNSTNLTLKAAGSWTHTQTLLKTKFLWFTACFAFHNGQHFSDYDSFKAEGWIWLPPESLLHDHHSGDKRNALPLEWAAAAMRIPLLASSGNELKSFALCCQGPPGQLWFIAFSLQFYDTRMFTCNYNSILLAPCLHLGMCNTISFIPAFFMSGPQIWEVHQYWKDAARLPAPYRGDLHIFFQGDMWAAGSDVQLRV